MDVLVADIGMPGEDGYTRVSDLRGRPPDPGGRIPPAALTAYARVDDRLKALAAGFEMHVTKPVEPAELVMVVDRLLRLTQPRRE